MNDRALPLLLGVTLCACTTGDPLRATLHVDASAPEGGDGSALHPLRTVQEALGTADVAVIQIAAGRYAVPAVWAFDQAITLRGAGDDTWLFSAEGERAVWSAPAPVTLATLGWESALEGSGAFTFDDVRFDGAAGPALHLADADATLVDVVVTTVRSGDGVLVERGTLTWEGGGVVEAPDRGLVIHGATATLSALELTSVLRAPLTVGDGAVVEASVIIPHAHIGVFVDDATLTLVSSTVSQASAAGLLVGNGAVATVRDSVFTGSPMGHIAAIGLDVTLTVTGNLLRGAAAASCLAVTASTSPVLVANNTIEDCAGSGVALNATGDVTVTGNTIAQIRPDPLFVAIADGISLLDTTGVVLANNRVHDTDGNGIALLRAAATIEGNEVGPCGGAGVSVVEAAPARVRIADNRIEAAVGAGILVLGAGADVTDNEVTATSLEPGDMLGEGIVLAAGADALVTGNRATNNATHGLSFFDGVTGTIDGNTFEGNAGYGIAWFCTGAPSNVTLGDNMLGGNGLGPLKLCEQR